MPTFEQVTPEGLCRVLVTLFTDGELRDLCRGMGIEYEHLPGQGKREKVRSLIAHFEHRRRFAELVVRAKRMRPDTLWSDTVQSPLEASATSRRTPDGRLLEVSGWGKKRRAAATVALILLILLAVALAAMGLSMAWATVRERSRLATAMTATLPRASTVTPLPTATAPAQPTTTPTSTHTPVPSPTSPDTATPLPTPPATLTPSPTEPAAPTATDTVVPSPTAIPTATAPPPQTATPTPTAPRASAFVPSATPRPTTTALPAPKLVEPESGACFADKVRLKFTWYRRLEEGESISIYVRSARLPAEFYWQVNEADAVYGGGAVHPVQGGYRFEVNSSLGLVPEGEAYWSVAIVGDATSPEGQVSPRSEERQIYVVPWPGKRLGCRPGPE